jgi:hypothetical protein
MGVVEVEVEVGEDARDDRGMFGCDCVMLMPVSGLGSDTSSAITDIPRYARNNGICCAEPRQITSSAADDEDKYDDNILVETVSVSGAGIEAGRKP